VAHWISLNVAENQTAGSLQVLRPRQFITKSASVKMILLLECGGLAPLWPTVPKEDDRFNDEPLAKAASGRRTPKQSAFCF